MDLWVLLVLLRQWKKTFVHGILNRDKANAYTYTSRSWVPEGLFLTTKLTIYLFSLPADIHDASDIADCSCRHMSHVTSVLEHRSPKCRGRGGGFFLIMNEREGESKLLGLSQFGSVVPQHLSLIELLSRPWPSLEFYQIIKWWTLAEREHELGTIELPSFLQFKGWFC